MNHDALCETSVPCEFDLLLLMIIYCYLYIQYIERYNVTFISIVYNLVIFNTYPTRIETGYILCYL